MKFLPKILITFLLLNFTFLAFPCPIFAQPATPSATLNTVGNAVTGQWTPDPDVTFAGKVAARSADLLNDVIANYQWSKYDQDKNPFQSIWISVRNIVYALLSLFILAGAFLIIITRGQSITVRKFIPRFIFIILLILLSFELIRFIYDRADDITRMFLYVRSEQRLINSSDLLNIAFDYKDFQGLKRVGSPGEFDEAAFISTLMIKLTAATYYAMFIILIVRKVILWFFIIVSPIFPLLLFFSPIRNTAKIWIGEFFRWLLYGPLFAIFLAGLVALWKIGIPLDVNKPCTPQDTEKDYPTAINILIGGPCQELAFKPEDKQFNSVNTKESFTQYVVALLMLWMVIIMPFILLKIFLDYFKEMQFGENGMLKYLLNSQRPKPKPPAPIKPIIHMPPIAPMPPISPDKFGAASLAKELSRSKDVSDSLAHLKPQLVVNMQSQKSISQVLDLTKLKIPTIVEVAKLDANSAGVEANKLSEALKRVSGTSTLLTPQEKQQSQNLRERLKTESEKGNSVADSILEAAKDEKDAKLNEENKLQTVSVEDYEEVKKTWEENYRNLEPPDSFDGMPQSRAAWLKEEEKQIPLAIDNLLSGDPDKIEQGKRMVSKILPFLLLGGFSKSEIVAYLRAKLEAAKGVLEEVMKEEKDEDTKVYVDSKQQEKPRVMVAEQEIEQKDKNNPI